MVSVIANIPDEKGVIKKTAVDIEVKDYLLINALNNLAKEVRRMRFGK